MPTISTDPPDSECEWLAGDYAGIRQLWAAVLALAVEDVAAGNALVSTSARQYILSDDASIGGFVFCCRILDLDVERTRRLALEG